MVKFNARCSTAAELDRRPRRGLAGAGDDRRHRRRSTRPSARSKRCDAGEPAVGFGEIYIQTGYDPTPAPEGKHLMSVFGQYAPYDIADGDWDSRRDDVASASSST